MRAPDFNKQKGELILYIGPMNSGKTETLVDHLRNLKEHAKTNLNVIGFAVDTNERDGEQIIGENGKNIPAHTIPRNNPSLILKRLEQEDEKSFVNVIAFDEINLYNHEIISVIKQLKQENRLILGAGLDKSFRGETFGIMYALKDLVDPSKLSEMHFNSYCKMLKDGEQCGNLATYTVRLRRDSNMKQQFYDKERKIITGFGYAPYFDPLVLIEEKGSNQVAYTVACEDCFEKPYPYQRETLQAYNELVTGKNPKDIKIAHLDEMIQMLLEEQKIRPTKNGRYTAQEYHYDMNTGIFIHN